MATVTRLVDDLNPELDAETQTFELMGQLFEIDLSEGNVPWMHDTIDNVGRLLAVARPMSTSVEGTENGEGGISSNRRSRSSGKSVSNSRTKKKQVRTVQRAVDGAPPKDVRKWCQDNGVEVSPTGIIQKSAYEAYNEAHRKG